MDFPRFDDTNPHEWPRTTKKNFSMVHVPEEAKFDYAQMYITGRADTWLRNFGVLEEGFTWNQLCEVLLQCFTGNNSYEVLEEFNNIKQGLNTVSEYTDHFEDKMANYRKENPEVKESYYIKCYINGLKGEIKHYMKTVKPTSLYEAVDYARDMELAANATTQNYSRRLNASTFASRNYSSTPTHLKPKPNQEPTITRKEVG